MDPIIDLMVNKSILSYCVHETWIVGNVNTVVRNHMIFRHNKEEREVGTRGIVTGGVAIILSPTAVTACRATGETSYNNPFTILVCGKIPRVETSIPLLRSI